jgi:hypothetical protein
MVRDKETAVPRRIDGWVLAAVCALLGLYVLNLGAGFHGYGLNWVHGTRLTAEPFLLLLYGFTVREPRRTYRAAIRSMALTACAVAAYGLLQQLAGAGRLIAWGYSYSLQVRLLPNGLLRSFGTLDDPFAYAALLLLAFAVTLFGIRRTSSAVPVGIVILLGLAVSYVRTAAVICVALIGLTLLMRKHTVQAFTLLAVSFFAGIILAVAASTHGATESRTVRGASPDIYLTLNGRTTAWKAALGGPLTLPFGRGVGTVGRAAQRAAFSVTQSSTATPTTVHAVDSGYFSTVADVGLVGLTVLLVLFGRLVALAARAARMRAREGWLALGLLTVMLFDALTRDSFAGFPTAFLGLLLVGLALANVPSAEARRGTVR